jgi:hypothetical protein
VSAGPALAVGSTAVVSVAASSDVAAGSEVGAAPAGTALVAAGAALGLVDAATGTLVAGTAATGAGTAATGAGTAATGADGGAAVVRVGVRVAVARLVVDAVVGVTADEVSDPPSTSGATTPESGSPEVTGSTLPAPTATPRTARYAVKVAARPTAAQRSRRSRRPVPSTKTGRDSTAGIGASAGKVGGDSVTAVSLVAWGSG